ncbi:MAG: SPOR domain-containing protein, partial [Thiogranum sp.]
VVRQKKIVPLRSNTGDIGLMQLNEKVWRGFYDVQKLRWDIAYNIHAGTEVLLNYLVRYALKQNEHKQRGGLDNLARATYSAYNGGPRQVSRYRNPAAASAHKKIDSAFWEKYRSVKQGKELHVAECLGGDKTDVAASKPAIEMKQSVDNKSKNVPAGQASRATVKADKSWVLEQNENYFTLQLAVFSTPKAARNFIDQESLSGVVASHPVYKDKRVLYAVLYGSYRNRSEADNAKRSLGHLKPWIRQFKELHR